MHRQTCRRPPGRPYCEPASSRLSRPLQRMGAVCYEGPEPIPDSAPTVGPLGGAKQVLYIWSKHLDTHFSRWSGGCKYPPEESPPIAHAIDSGVLPDTDKSKAIRSDETA